MMPAPLNHKSILALLVLLVMIGGLALIPFQVQATVPTIDYVAIGKLIKQIAEAVYQSGQLSALVVKEYVLDPAVKLLAALMLQAITRNIIEWIQGGGNTNFVSNLQAALNRAADEAAGEFLNILAGTNLCSPFAGPVRSAFQAPRVSLSGRLSCTASDIFRNLQTSYEEFLNDFTKGGWIALNATMSGSNNYIDTLINTYDAKLREESQRVGVTYAQYQAGQGFLGVRVKKKVCSDFAMTWEDCPTVDVQTTPGKLVADQLSSVFTSGIDQAVATDEIAEAIDAIIGALINKLISSAQAGLLGGDTESGLYDPGLSSPAPIPPPPPPPDQISIQADIIKADNALNSVINPALGTASSTLPEVTAAISVYSPRVSGETDPLVKAEGNRLVTRLRQIETDLTVAESTLQSSAQKLLAWRQELVNLDFQIRQILSQPDNPDSALLAQLYSRTRQISLDIEGEISDEINPADDTIRQRAAEAGSVIQQLRQLF